MDQTTTIEHKDGTRTTVETNERGDHTVTRTDNGGGQVGNGKSHEAVVKDHTEPGDKVKKQ